jgi:tripartite-type tricarboxylate transporter receptor subunit TctC
VILAPTPLAGRYAAVLAAMVAVLSLPHGARAQDYPTRPVSFIVPYAAGGTTDTMARLLGQKLEQRLGKPFVVENKTGAATVIGAVFVAKSPPDGHTLLYATSTTMAINVTARKNLPYDPTRDLAPVALVAGIPFILVVNPALPIRSIGDLVALAKRQPLSYASNGHGGAPHLFMELLKTTTGIAAMTHVPYKGLAPALNDTVAGHVHVMFGDFSTTLPLVQAGKLRALGVSTAQRVAAAPDIAPLGEAGLPGFEASSWQMIVAPGSTPKEIVARLNAELRAIVGDPEVSKYLADSGIVPIVSASPDELAAYVKTEIVRWGRIVEHAGAAGVE